VVAVGDCAAWYDPSVGAAHRVEHWTGALERPAIAVSALLAGGAHQGAVAKAPYFWSDQYGARIQFAGIARPGDVVTIEEGDCQTRCFVATYHRDGRLVAVLAVDQPRLFNRLRRQIAATPAPV
jgi:NADPH-dependent 2,4-dienoyl-CoA reductase/sulfur reductase-like enzyme